MPSESSDLTALERRALARGLSWLENDDPRGAALLAEARAAARLAPALVIGVTGPPGAGKSSLVARLAALLRERGLMVAILAVDPSSPFSGGAVLGDRIRMGGLALDPGVFIRSMATRGRLGGLSRATTVALTLLEGRGFGVVIVETVGVGQSEVDVARLADHTLLVLTPNVGDGVQAAKAGVMEVADVLVINKADLPGVERLERELQASVALMPHDARTWLPPVLRAQATALAPLDGVAGLLAAVLRHRDHLGAAGLRARRLERARLELEGIILEAARRATLDDSGLGAAILDGTLSPLEAARRVLER